MRTSNQRSIAPAQRQELSTVSILKRMLSGDELKRRFSDILGEKAPQFMASIVNATAGNSALQSCDPQSILSASLVAATLDLPIDQNLGFAALVPYSGKAQFQMMWRGYVQLAQRSGLYKAMGRGYVYEDELEYYNPVYGEFRLVEDFSKCTQRKNSEDDKIVGYIAWFDLLNGFHKELFMSKEDVEHHAATYSKSYQYDKKNSKKTSRWSIDFKAMANKTTIKRLLKDWGPLSVDMQTAMREDQKVYDADGASSYADNPENDDTPYLDAASESDFIEAEATEATPEEEAEAKEMESLFGEE